jgi:hypothetical protein
MAMSRSAAGPPAPEPPDHRRPSRHTTGAGSVTDAYNKRQPCSAACSAAFGKAHAAVVRPGWRK